MIKEVDFDHQIVPLMEEVGESHSLALAFTFQEAVNNLGQPLEEARANALYYIERCMPVSVRHYGYKLVELLCAGVE